MLCAGLGTGQRASCVKAFNLVARHRPAAGPHKGHHINKTVVIPHSRPGQAAGI